MYPHVQLGEVASPVYRSEEPIAGKPYRQVGVRLWGQGAYERETIDGSETRYKTLNKAKLDDIIVNKIWARNGSVSLIREDTNGCYASNEFPLFEPDQKQLFPQWFFYLTKTSNFWNQCSEKSFGTSGKNRIRPEKFLEIEIPLPPLDEQRRIVAQIESIAARIEEARGLRQQAVEEAEALLNSAISAIFIKFAGLEWLTIGKICDVRGGIQKSKDRIPNQNPRRYLTVAHVQRNWIDTDDPRYFEVSDEELEKWRLYAGDVLVVEGNGSEDQIGRTSLFRGEIEDCVHQNHIIRIRPDKTRLVPEFLNHYLNSPLGRNNMKEISRTSSGLYHLSVGKIKSISIPLPSCEEQFEIINFLDDLYEHVGNLTCHQHETGAELDALLPSMLDKAFKGELAASQVTLADAFHLTERQRVLLDILVAASNMESQPEPEPVIITEVMKYSFLYDKECNTQEKQHYVWEGYHYGPFSQEIYTDLEVLVSFGLVVRTKGKKRGGKDISYPRSEKVDAINEHLNRLDADVRQNIRNIVTTYEHRNVNDLLRQVYAKYPEFADKSKRKDLLG